MLGFIGGVLAIAGTVILFLFFRFMYSVQGVAGMLEIALYIVGFVIEFFLLRFAFEFVLDSIGIAHSKIKKSFSRKK